jgi:hypothetical protein
MTPKEAKDFLVQQPAEHAAIDGVPLSDLEKRMMHFVENDPTSCADPLELNEEFEAQCDTAEYETKIARLLHNAYKRLKTEDHERIRCWEQDIRTLGRGDHYLPVLWSTNRSKDRPLRDFGIGLPIAAVIALVIILMVK